MRQMFIPTIGDTYTLAEDWTFTIGNDHRNVTIITWAGKLASSSYYPLGAGPGTSWQPLHVTIEVTLPKGTLLRVDRIYIRKGKKDYDSLTFYASGPGLKAMHQKQNKTLRFFASLADVNKMVVEN